MLPLHDLNPILPIRLLSILLCLLSTAYLPAVLADEIKVAVASNFSRTLSVLSQQFEKQTGHRVKLLVGSTGKHYAQIVHGAPFDAYFAADSLRPALLEQAGLGQTQTRFTYAIGKLVLWSPVAHYVDPQGNILQNGSFQYLAIANPRLAPYGKAAMQVLQQRHLWTRYRKRLVRGENIGQTYQFIKSGNAQLGFIAYSQVLENKSSGSYWVVPQALYSPIEQQALLLTDNQTARDFLAFVRSSTAIDIISQHGYDKPP